MGRRTTKGGRILNPADAYRKKLRKKEIKKNKVQRKKVRDLILATKNPDKIRQQINDINRLESSGKAEKRHKAKKKQLLDTLEKVLARQRVEGDNTENPEQSMEEPVRESVEDLTGNQEPAFYHPPPFAPFGTPPPRFRPPPQLFSPIPAEPFHGPTSDQLLPGPPPGLPPTSSELFPAPPPSPPPSDLPAPPPGPPPDEALPDNNEVPPPPKSEEPPPLPNDPPPLEPQPSFPHHPNRPPMYHPPMQPWQYPPPPFPPGQPSQYPPAPMYYMPFPPQPPMRPQRIETVPQVHMTVPISEGMVLPMSSLRMPQRKFAGVPTAVRIKRNGQTSKRVVKNVKYEVGEEGNTTQSDDVDFEKYMEEMKALGACD